VDAVDRRNARADGRAEDNEIEDVEMTGETTLCSSVRKVRLISKM